MHMYTWTLVWVRCIPGSLSWRIVGSNDIGKIDVNEVDYVKAVKALEFAILSREGEIIQQVEADSMAERDAWVTSLTEVLRSAGRSKPQAQEPDTSMSGKVSQSPEEFEQLI